VVNDDHRKRITFIDAEWHHMRGLGNYYAGETTMCPRTEAGMTVGKPKTKIYLDTSVLRSLYDDDRQDFRECTWRLWNRCMAGEYEVCISPTVVEELDGAPLNKRKRIRMAMETVEIQTLPKSAKAERLADEYVKQGVLSEKNRNDCLHLAYASVYDCDTLVSWNYRHLVRPTTSKGTKDVNSANQFGVIDIDSPAMLLGEEDPKWPSTAP
jgi:predicted nucleic acid-binding protein